MATIKAGTYRFNEEIFVDSDRSLTEYFYFTRMTDKSEVVLQAGISVRIEYGDVVVSYCRDDASLFVGVYRGDWAYDECRTITIDEDPEVSEEFAAWFTANTNEVKTTATIKAGTYRFNNVLTAPSFAEAYESVQFSSNGTDYDLLVGGNGSLEDGVFLGYGIVSTETMNYAYSSESASVLTGFTGWASEAFQTITIPTDAEVSAEFLEWFTANANPTVSGKWKLNSTINCIPYDVYEVGAASPEQRQAFLDTYGANIVPVSTTVDGFTATVSRVSPGIVMGDMYEDGQPADLSEGIVYEADVDGYGKVNGWESADYFCGMTVDFGDELQAVSEVFYNWLIENAAPVVEHTVSGVWKFKDVLTKPNFQMDESTDFTANYSYNGYNGTVLCSGLKLVEGDGFAWRIRSTFNYLSDPDFQVIAENVLGVSFPFENAIYTEYNNGEITFNFTSYGFDFQTIDFGTEQTVSAEFYDWFTANAVEQVPQTISGKWKFKDNTSSPSDAYASFDAEINFVSNGKNYIRMERYSGSTHDDLKYWYSADDYDLAYESGDSDSYMNDWASEAYKSIDFGTEPQTVSAEFYNWLTANATQPMASVSHNGEEIASLFPGQTATLKCAGMKMAGDVVVAVADNVGGGGDANIVPLTVTENGGYDTYYETGTEVWDSNTEYAGSVTVDGVTLSFKKAEHLIVPDDLNELKKNKYTGTCEFVIDGETVTREEPLIDNLEITQGVCAAYQTFAVIWVKQAAPLNEQFGISFLEDNTVYITNLMQMSFAQGLGATYVKTICKAPTKKVENVAYHPVNVELPISDEVKTLKIGAGQGSYFTTDMYYNCFQINGPDVQPLYITPSAVMQHINPDEGKCFTSVTVGAVDLSDLSSMHILCGIYMKTLPQTQYAVGEWLNADGGVIVAQYTDGTTAEVPLSHEYIWGFTTNNPGVIRLTVKYSEGGITSQTVYDITVT